MKIIKTRSYLLFYLILANLIAKITSSRIKSKKSDQVLTDVQNGALNGEGEFA